MAGFEANREGNDNGPGLPATNAVDRRRAARKAAGSRRRKQLVMGAGFLTLLGAGWAFPVVGYFIPACMVLGIGMAVRRGRSWCNWLCPRGSFADAYLAAVSPSRRIPAWLMGMAVRIVVMSFLMGMLTYQVSRLWPDLIAIGGFFVLLLTVTTALGVLLALAIHPRSWCYVCPIGTMSNWVGRAMRPLGMSVDSCIECGLCAKACPMQLSPVELKGQARMSHGGDCLKCGLCVAACPKDALAFRPRAAA